MNGTINDTINPNNDPVKGGNDLVNEDNDLVNGESDPVNEQNDLDKKLKSIYNIVSIEPDVTYSEIAQKLNISIATVKRNLQKLKERNYIKREGADKNGKWILLK